MSVHLNWIERSVVGAHVYMRPLKKMPVGGVVVRCFHLSTEGVPLNVKAQIWVRDRPLLMGEVAAHALFEWAGVYGSMAPIKVDDFSDLRIEIKPALKNPYEVGVVVTSYRRISGTAHDELRRLLDPRRVEPAR